MSVKYYRYITDVQERNQIRDKRRIQSLNPATGFETWYTPVRYDDPRRAQRELALPAPDPPTYRVGPVPADELPNFAVAPRRVAPAFGHPGGGIEASTREPVWMSGVWDFVNQAYDPI